MNETVRGRTIVGSVKKSLSKANIYGRLNLQNVYLLKLIDQFLNMGVGCLPFETRQRLETLYNHIKYNDKDICNIRERDLTSFKHVPFYKECGNNFRLKITKGLPMVNNAIANSDTDYIFQTRDFTTNFSDPYDGSYKTVRITSLPSNGILKYNGENVAVGFEFNIANVNNLVLSINGLTGVVSTFFTFQTSNDNINTLFSNMATFTINIDAQINQPPSTVGDNSITIANSATYIFTVADFTTNTTPPYADPEGDAAENLRILSLPVDGEIQFNGVTVTLNQIIPFTGAQSIASGLLRYVASATNPAADIESFNFEISDSGSNTFVG